MFESLPSLQTKFNDLFGEDPQIVARAPGRVNIIGEHTDYNEGYVLPAAISRETVVLGRIRTDEHYRVHSEATGATASFCDQPDILDSVPEWLKYIRGTVRLMKERAGATAGLDIAVFSDIPRGSGLSASASLEVALAALCQRAWHCDLDALETARLCQQVEHQFLGVRSGLMDQLASLLGKPDHALLIDCRSFEVHPIPIDKSRAQIIIFDTKTKHALASSGYNERVRECQAGLELLRRTTGRPLGSLRDVGEEDLQDSAKQFGESPVGRRVRHVVSENKRTIEAAEALRRNDLDHLGRLMIESHRSLKDDYEVSCPELDALVYAGSELAGVYGIRLTGAGFGGCAVALVKPEAAPEVITHISEKFRQRFGFPPTAYVCEITAGASSRMF